MAQREHGVIGFAHWERGRSWDGVEIVFTRVHAMASRMLQDADLNRVGESARNVAQGTMPQMLIPEQQIFFARGAQRKIERNR